LKETLAAKLNKFRLGKIKHKSLSNPYIPGRLIPRGGPKEKRKVKPFLDTFDLS